MKHLKTLLGVACLLIMGFIAYCVVTGFGILVAIIFLTLPTWQIVLGTVIGSVATFAYLVREEK